MSHSINNSLNDFFFNEIPGRIQRQASMSEFRIINNFNGFQEDKGQSEVIEVNHLKECFQCMSGTEVSWSIDDDLVQ